MKLSIRETPGLELLLEAALCAWEWMLENHNGQLLNELWDGLGSSAMRHCAMQAGQIALETFELMESNDIEFCSSYDWEFVPAVMERLDWEKLTEHNQYNGPAYEPSLEALLADIMLANERDFETPMKRWTAEARRQAVKQWGYPEMLEDLADRIDISEPPADWVRRLGEKYDLIPAGDFK